MESKWGKKRERKLRFISAFRSLRIPILTALGTFVVAFFIIPFAFNGIAAPSSMALEVEAPDESQATSAPSPTPVPTEAQPEAAQTQSLPEQTALTPAVVQATDDPGTAYPALQFGSTDAQVALIQQRLMDLFYMESDEPTDYFGPATEAAVMRFQRTHYMKETGVADSQTQAVLFSESAKPYVIEKGYSGDDVLTLQARLGELGYYSDKLNGYFGTATYRAVSAFQTKNGLTADGRADFDTRELIFSPAAKPAVDPTPTPTPTKTPKPTVTATPKPSASAKPTGSAAGSSTPAPSSTSGGWSDPGHTSTPTQTDTPSYTQTPVTANGDVDDFIAVAKQQIGKRYVYSTEGPDTFDCSGLVFYCLRAVGVNVSRYSASGFSQVSSWTTVYGKENLRPGDLLFYKSDGSSSTYVTHVAIWLGNNQILHASTSAGQVCYTTWGTWSENNFLFAKRVFG
jgi:cell wall-associated NlpC family hydrolase